MTRHFTANSVCRRDTTSAEYATKAAQTARVGGGGCESGDAGVRGAEGLARSAWVGPRPVLVRVAVVLASVIAGGPCIKAFGTGRGGAILLDATIVRLLVVPAAMRMLGQWNWWMPTRLARLLPAASN